MTKLIALSAAGTGHDLVHFNRTELTLLLNLYARRMALGEWRDYAIDHGTGCAVFSVYGRTLESPVLTISKLTANNRPVYVVIHGERELARCGALADALAALDAAFEKAVRA